MGRSCLTKRSTRSRCKSSVNCAIDADSKLPEDWREVRARLVAMERGEVSANRSYVYETPLIEKASILLDASKPDEIHSEFHKTVVLLIDVEPGDFTMGLILNRPSKMSVNEWPLWYGGPVGHGEIFAGDDSLVSADDLQILCLHTLDSNIAKENSFQIMPGIWACGFLEAEELLEQGVAKSKDDFRAIAGYAGWAPEQLDDEVEFGGWAIASADSRMVLQDFLQKQPPTTLPQMAGFEIWEKLMISIGRREEVEESRNSIGDAWIQNWIMTHLISPGTEFI